MSFGAKSRCKAWTWLVLGTALSGFLFAAVPQAAAQGDAGLADKPVAKLLADAQTAVRAGNYRLALINLRNAVRVAPSDSTAHFQLGLVLLQTNDLAMAEREMRLALKTGGPEREVLPYLFQIMLARLQFQNLLDQYPDPGASTAATAPDILKARSFALQRLGRTAEARDAGDRALKLRRDAQGLLARGMLALQQGDINATAKFADEALKSAPDNAGIALFKLRALRLSGNGAGAKALSESLLAKFPDRNDVKFAHIEILLDQKQPAAARAEAEAILAKQSGSVMAKYYKALAISQSGDARGAWDVALTLPKEFLEQSTSAGLAVAQLAVNAGRHEVAADILGRVLGKDAGNVPVRRRLAELYLEQSNANSALNVLGPVKESSDPETVRLLARVYDDLDRPADAQRALKRVGAGNQNSVAVPHALAELRAGRTDQAIKELKDAAAKEPGNPAIVGPLIGALVQARRFPEALEIADRLGQDPRQRVIALVYRGDTLMLQRKMPEAKIAFDRAIGLEPKNQAALISRANFFSVSQEYDDAAKDLRALLSSDSNNVVARLRLADIAARQGKDQEVRKLLAEAIAVSQDPTPRIALARYLMTRKDNQAALKVTDDLLRLQPANVEGVALRGQVQSALGRKQEAVASFRRLVSLNPKAPEPQMLLGDALFAAGDRAGAQRALEDAVKLSPDSPLVKGGQVNLQFALGNADAAVASARAFQASHPGSQGDILLADALTKVKRYDQASDILTKSLAAKPDQLVLSRLIQLKILMNDKKGAVTLMSQWLARNPDDMSVRQVLAMVLMGERDNQGARTQYEVILKQDAGNVLAMNNLGSLIQSSDPKRAGALFTKAVQLAPNSPEIADSLGWFKVQQKDAAGGLPLLQRAHDLKPQDGTITYHLAVALDANAKRDAARALLKNLLASGAKFDELADARRLAANWK